MAVLAAAMVTVGVSRGTSGGPRASTVPTVSSAPASSVPPIEQLAFTAEELDRTLVRLYAAYFNRTPDLDGLEYWRDQTYAGMSPHTVSSAFAASQEFQARYGHLSDEQFVDLVYSNVLERTPDVSGRSYWTGMLRFGLSRGELMLGFSESNEFVVKTADWVIPVRPAPLSYEEERGQLALDRIAYQWEQKLPGWTIEFTAGRANYYGLTFPSEHRIIIYVRSSQTDSHLAHVVAHEMGHAVDIELNSGTDRRRWLAQRGIDAAWWPVSDGIADSATGAGDFAESFADWQLSTGIFESQLAGRPDLGDRLLMAELSNS